MDEETKKAFELIRNVMDQNTITLIKDITALKDGQNKIINDHVEILNICKHNKNSLDELIKRARGLPA